MGSSAVRVKGKGVAETMIQQDNISDRNKLILLLVGFVITLLIAMASTSGQ